MDSMTGFGRSRCMEDGREMTIEVKSVNHRFLDISFRFPKSLGYLEETARPILSSFISRGHVDLTISYLNLREDAKEVHVDLALADAYRDAMRTLGGHLNLNDEMMLSEFAALPDLLKIREREDDAEAVARLFEKTLRAALEQLKEMRSREGAALARDVLIKTDALHALKDQIETRSAGMVEAYREKLSARLSELLQGKIDESRFETEVAIFADRSAIDEELVRLDSHLRQIRELLNMKEPVGRKLDFLVQELNREINTIGSKAGDAAIAGLVVEAKSIIEKIREQIQNLE